MSQSKSLQDPIIHEGHSGRVKSVAFSPEGVSVASASKDNTIRFWDARSQSPPGKVVDLGKNNDSKSISYSPSGTTIISGSFMNTVRQWSTDTCQQVGEPLKGHIDVISSVAFSSGGDLIASGSHDKTVRLWSTQNTTPTSRPLVGHRFRVTSVAFSPDGGRIASGSADHTVLIWDCERGTSVVGPLDGHTRTVYSVSYSPDGSQIISGSMDETLRLWDTRSGRTIDKPYQGHTDAVYSVAFSPNGTYVASGSLDATIRIWDVRTGRQVLEPLERHTAAVNSVAFSPCGKLVASGSGDKKVMIWGISGGDLNSGDSHDDFGSFVGAESIREHMSIQEMFDILIRHGCIDLASEMDTKQEGAVLMSGGGFGDIWRGELRNGVKVAIKAWRASFIEQCDYRTLKRATREIYYWSKMKHDNVHQLMGVIMFKGQSLGMVSDWIENGNLHEYLRKNPSANRFQLSLQIASGVAYIHSHNMVHGDIKAVGSVRHLIYF